jgi:hypothetical protein
MVPELARKKRNNAGNKVEICIAIIISVEPRDRLGEMLGYLLQQFTSDPRTGNLRK